MSLKTLALSALLATGVASGTTAVSTVAFGSPAELPEKASAHASAAHAARSTTARSGSDAAPASTAQRAQNDVAAAPCPADVKNHGAYVSSVAHAPRPSEDPSAGKGNRGRGPAVSAAARSDCGKPAADEARRESAERSKPVKRDKRVKARPPHAGPRDRG